MILMIYTAYVEVGQLKVKYDEVMCNLSMNFSDMYDQNPTYFDRIVPECILNKAYRPNAHLLYIVMHYNGNII